MYMFCPDTETAPWSTPGKEYNNNAPLTAPIIHPAPAVPRVVIGVVSGMGHAVVALWALLRDDASRVAVTKPRRRSDFRLEPGFVDGAQWRNRAELAPASPSAAATVVAPPASCQRRIWNPRP